jgi:hypothetical protein
VAVVAVVEAAAVRNWDEIGFSGLLRTFRDSLYIIII